MAVPILSGEVSPDAELPEEVKEEVVSRPLDNNSNHGVLLTPKVTSRDPNVLSLVKLGGATLYKPLNKWGIIFQGMRVCLKRDLDKHGIVRTIQWDQAKHCAERLWVTWEGTHKHVSMPYYAEELNQVLVN